MNADDGRIGHYETFGSFTFNPFILRIVSIADNRTFRNIADSRPLPIDALVVSDN